jgi:formate--tetrahydrofolate ligase
MENTVLHTQTLLPIEEIARKLSLLPAEYEPIGTYGAKLKLDLLDNPAFPVVAS